MNTVSELYRGDEYKITWLFFMPLLETASGPASMILEVGVHRDLTDILFIGCPDWAPRCLSGSP